MSVTPRTTSSVLIQWQVRPGDPTALCEPRSCSSEFAQRAAAQPWVGLERPAGAEPWCECDLQGGKSSAVVTCRVNRSAVGGGGAASRTARWLGRGRPAGRLGGPRAQPARWPSHPRRFPLLSVAEWQLLGVAGPFQCGQKTFPGVPLVNWELTALSSLPGVLRLDGNPGGFSWALTAVPGEPQLSGPRDPGRGTGLASACGPVCHSKTLTPEASLTPCFSSVKTGVPGSPLRPL